MTPDSNPNPKSVFARLAPYAGGLKRLYIEAPDEALTAEV